MGFNSAFKGLIKLTSHLCAGFNLILMGGMFKHVFSLS